MREPTPPKRRTTVTDERAERILADALKGRGGALTKSDAVVLTGLPADETESALRSLLKSYRSHLAVTEKGELIYQFDPAMVRRDAVPLKEKLRAVGEALWKGFTVLFKIWIVVTLVAYVIAFVAMMIALVFARSSNDRDSRRRSDDGFGFPMIWWLMPDWRPAGSYGGGYGRRALPTGPQKRFYVSAFDYVFGPKSTVEDPLGMEKEFVSYLRSVDGRVTATDIVELTGWSYTEAEEELTRLLVDYEGEPEVAEDGTLVYVFPSLRRTAALPADGGGSAGNALVRSAGNGRDGFRYAWQRSRTLPPLTGNSSGTNTVVTLMNGFNLVASLSIGPAFLAKYGIDSDAANMLVTAFPLAFSSIFFAVPAARALRRSRKQKRLIAEEARAKVLAEIVRHRGAGVTPEALCAASGLPTEAATKILDRLLADLDGDVATDDNGQVLYTFPRIAEELAAADAARLAAPAAEREAGAVVFSSDEDHDAADEEPAEDARLTAAVPPRQLN